MDEINEKLDEYGGFEGLFTVMGMVFITVLIIGTIVEVGILIYGYVHADEVKCNFLWCEFTEHRGSINQSISMSQECTVNGVKVNCSEMDVDNSWVGWVKNLSQGQ